MSSHFFDEQCLAKFSYEYVSYPAGVIAIIMIVILGVVEVMVFKERIPEHKKYFYLVPSGHSVCKVVHILCLQGSLVEISWEKGKVDDFLHAHPQSSVSHFSLDTWY